MLKKELEKNFTVDNIIKSPEELISMLKEINEISFTDVESLFNQDTKRRRALIDLTGINAPEKFTLSSKYPKSAQLKNFINDLFASQSKEELSNLVIKGTGNDDFEFVYNADSFVQKVTIQAVKNDKGTFDSDEVKNELLKAL